MPFLLAFREICHLGRRAVVLAGALSLACATSSAGAGGAARELPTTCPVGPACVAGEVNDMFGGPLKGVRCIVRTAAGPPAIAETDASGFFLLDGLAEAPSFVEFEGPGLVTETKPLVRPPRGQASRVFMVLARE